MTIKIQSNEKCKYCQKPAIELNRKEIERENRTDYLVRLACKHSIILKGSERRDYTTIISSDKRKLYPFQVTGCQFIEKTNFRAGIFDEQGLGKTIQAIVPLLNNKELWPFAIACKSGLKIQFFSELVRWLGLPYFAQVIQKPTDFILPQAKGYIFSHDILRGFSNEQLEKFNIKYLIIDECQAFKNPDSARTKKLTTWIKSIPHIIATSGTPIKNRPSEYFTILNILNPLKFPSNYLFRAKYIKYKIDKEGNLKEAGLKNEDLFARETENFLIRRERKQIFAELPTINRQFYNVDLEEETKEAYNKGESELADLIAKYKDSGDSKEYANILAEINHLRQIVGLAKVKYCANFVSELLLTTSKKVTIFVHHRATGNFLEELIKRYCKDMGIDMPLRISGGMESEKRFEIQKLFAEKGKHRVLIASTLAAGEGLNLQYQCFTCIILERQWNPANEEQAESRFTRPDSPQMGGQVDSVYMIAPATIDEYLTKMVEEKRQIFDEVINKRKKPWNENELMRELLNAIRRKNLEKGIRF